MHRFFSRPEFTAEPERAHHGLVVEVSPGAAVPAGVRNVLSMRSIRPWRDRLEVPRGHRLARLRRGRELDRPVALDGPGVRVVLLEYAGGAADFIVVAHRAALGQTGLIRLARALVAPEPGLVTVSAAPYASLAWPKETGAARTGRGPVPSFGLGDPARAGRYGSVELFARTPCGAPLPLDVSLDRVVAAFALVLDRYGYRPGEHAAAMPIGLVTDGAGPAGLDTVSVAPIAVADDDTVAALVDRAATLAGGGAAEPDRVPSVGVVWPGPRPAGHYRSGPVFPITICWADRPRCLFDDAYVSPPIAAWFAQHLSHAIALLTVRPPRTPLAELELMTLAEIRAVLAAGRVPAPAAAVSRTIPAAFSAVARRHPDAVACSDDDAALTYRELDENAERLARALRESGAEPGSRVGVCLNPGVELVVVLLAVLKTGAAYVPMDVRAPADRIRFTVQDARLTMVVTDRENFPAAPGLPVVSPGDGFARGDAASTVSAMGTADPGDPAYVIYTSGSTGRPKGVVVPHRNVLALLAATKDDMRLGSDDVWTLYHSSAFDFSVWEIWGCLLTGGHLVCVPYWVARSPEEFHKLLANRHVTVLSQTPSAFTQLQRIDAAAAGEELAVRLVVFGGEPLDVTTLRGWHDRHPRTRMVNMFGITETTVHVTSHTVTPADMATGSRSVGTALPGWSVSVRDRRGRPLPYGVSGEIYVGGAGVAAGYWHRPTLTAERFIEDPYGGGRVYCSGDRGRLHPDGRLDHLGRLDNQVQVRGYRIELDEIRSVLLEDPDVTAAVVVHTGQNGDAAATRIDAYVVLGGDGRAARVRRRAARILPEYMLPNTVTAVPELPLTINGKIDVARLPSPALRTDGNGAAAGSGNAAAGGADEITATLLRIWTTTFGTDVSADDDFFELGGNSLLAVQIFAAQRAAGLPVISLRELYMRPTITQLASAMTSNNTGDT